MNNPLSPVEIIYGIDKMQGAGSSDVEIIRNIARLAERTARNFIKKAGFAPDLMTYCFVPDDDLSHGENKKERLKFERLAWYNEASHLIDIPDIELATAAFTIIEARQFTYFLDTGQAEKAIISMANLLACGLLQSEQDKEGAINVLRNRHKKQGSNGGKGKKGFKKPIKQYIEKAYKSLKLNNELSPDKAARRILKLFTDDNAQSIYKEIYPDNELCPIIAIEYNNNEKRFFYYATHTPDKEDSLSFDRLIFIIRELRRAGDLD